MCVCYNYNIIIIVVMENMNINKQFCYYYDEGLKDPDSYSDTHASWKTRRCNIDVYWEEEVDDMKYENFLESMEPIFELIKFRKTKINKEKTHTLLAGYGFLFKFVKMMKIILKIKPPS